MRIAAFCPCRSRLVIVSESSSQRVCIGRIVGAHGVRGAVKLKSFTADPAAVAAYGALSDATGQRRFTLRLIGQGKDHLLAEITGLNDRSAAEALRGTDLYVERSQLPETDEDEFYHVDLIGLEAVGIDGSRLGRVVAVPDYGGGAILEIRADDGASLLVPFTLAAVPTVDFAAGRVMVDPPEEVEVKPEAEADQADAEAGAP